MFAGLAPGSVGLDQIAFQLPPDSPTGNAVALAITAGVSSISTNLAVQLRAVRIQSISPTSGAPLSMVTINGQGFDPEVQYEVRFFDQGGFSATVAALLANSTGIAVSVPPFFDASGSFTEGTVSVEVRQISASGAANTSNALAGFQIAALPAPSPLPPGTATLAFLNANIDANNELQASIAGTGFDTPEMRSSLAAQAATLRNLAAQVQAVMNGAGPDVTVSLTDLATSDRLLLGLMTVFAGPAPDLTPFGLSPAFVGVRPLALRGSRLLASEANAVQTAAQAALAAMADSATRMEELNRAFATFSVSVASFAREHPGLAAAYAAAIVEAMAATAISPAAAPIAIGLVGGAALLQAGLGSVSGNWIVAAAQKALGEAYCSSGAHPVLVSVLRKLTSGLGAISEPWVRTARELLGIYGVLCSEELTGLVLLPATVAPGKRSTGVVSLSAPAGPEGARAFVWSDTDPSKPATSRYPPTTPVGLSRSKRPTGSRSGGS
jgi:hypothetical protein